MKFYTDFEDVSKPKTPNTLNLIKIIENQLNIKMFVPGFVCTQELFWLIDKLIILRMWDQFLSETKPMSRL